MMAAVAVDIVSGFLGSGKTTLLRYVLAHGLRERRVAVIMNEMGEVGIDGKVITGLGSVEKMVELSSGCICCSIEDYRFDLAVQEIVDTVRPDFMIIESTGLADPGALAARARAAGLAIDAVIVVVDTASIERCVSETIVARAQIEAADFLVLNKIDLVEQECVDRVRRRLARLNNHAVVFRATRGAVASPLLFAPGVSAYRRSARAAAANAHSEQVHVERDGIGAFVYYTRRCLRQEIFERVVARLPRDVYRAKGILRFAGSDWQVLFNYTCGRSESNWFQLSSAGAESQLVIIGRDCVRYRDRVLDGFKRCEVEA